MCVFPLPTKTLYSPPVHTPSLGLKPAAIPYQLSLDLSLRKMTMPVFPTTSFFAAILLPGLLPLLLRLRRRPPTSVPLVSIFYGSGGHTTEMSILTRHLPSKPSINSCDVQAFVGEDDRRSRGIAALHKVRCLLFAFCIRSRGIYLCDIAIWRKCSTGDSLTDSDPTTAGTSYLPRVSCPHRLWRLA